MEEYYIRDPETEESRGPFTVEQLTSLGETGHVTLETLIYNSAIESWEVLDQNETLRTAVFPEKKRLTMKPKAAFDSLNKGEADLPPITVDFLLAASEGNTEETKHRKQEGIWREKAAVFAMSISAVALLLSAAAMLWLQKGNLFEFDLTALLTSPLVILALLDLGVALVLFLQTTAFYPFLRFRTMLGAGFFLFFFWAVGQPLVGVAAALGSIGIYGLTLFLAMTPFLVSAGLAVFGMLAFLLLAIGVG